jgi:peptide/nickel transport system substrate-binding protein
MPQRFVLSVVILMLIAIGCAPSQGRDQTTAASSSQPAQTRTLVVAHRYEPSNLAPKVLQSNGTLNTARLFNAALSVIDDQGIPRPYLAEALPELSTDTWRVLPDGRMETTYKLRENLTWQDGASLTADDFAFSFRVYTDPVLGVFISTPQDLMEAVLAPDPRTVVIQWRATSPIGGSLSFEDFDPLPHHLLEGSFADYAQGRMLGDAFMADAVWTVNYVGAGPYRLERWDQGVQLEGSAFAGHALGRPKIDRVVVRIFIDENQTMASVLTGGVLDYVCCNTLRFNQYATLKREWEPSGKGTAVASPGSAVYLYLQQRPEYVGHEALLDLRVRRALSHAVDRQALNEGLFDGLGIPSESPIPPNLPYSAEADRLMTHYPLDLNRASQLMSQAGFTRDAGGFYADAQGRRFFMPFSVQAASEIERMQTILSDSWRQAGFEVHADVVAPQVYTQLETRHTLPGVGYAFFQGEAGFYSPEIGTAANRWRGRNRTGWSSPEYDRLYDAWNAALERTERERYVAQMMAIASDSVPGYGLYFSQGILAWTSSLRGPTGKEASQFGTTSRPTTAYWNMQDWSFTQ